jgi:hypothetical protein
MNTIDQTAINGDSAKYYKVGFFFFHFKLQPTHVYIYIYNKSLQKKKKKGYLKGQRNELIIRAEIQKALV